MANAKSTRAPARNVSAKASTSKKARRGRKAGESLRKVTDTEQSWDQFIEQGRQELCEELEAEAATDTMREYLSAVIGWPEGFMEDDLEGWDEDPAAATYRAACEMEDEYDTHCLRGNMERMVIVVGVLARELPDAQEDHQEVLIRAVKQQVQELKQQVDAVLAERFCMAYRGERGVDLDEPHIVSKRFRLLGLPPPPKKLLAKSE